MRTKFLIVTVLLFSITALFAITTETTTLKNAPPLDANTLQHIQTNLSKNIISSSAPASIPNKTAVFHNAVSSWKGQAVNLRSKFQSHVLPNAKIRWSEHQTPVFIDFSSPLGSTTGLQKSSPGLAALQFIQEHAEFFKLENPENELTISDVSIDRFGKQHVKLTQQYQDIPVWGQDLVLHYNKNGALYGLNARYSPTPKLNVTSGTLSAEHAIRLAKAQLEGSVTFETLPPFFLEQLDYNGPTAKKYIWVEGAQPRVVWHVQIRPNLRDNWYIFVDAETGNIVQKYNATNFDGPVQGSGVDLNGQTRMLSVYLEQGAYYMIDASRPMWENVQPNLLNDPKGALWTIDVNGQNLDQEAQLFHVTSPNNTWQDAVSVSAHYNVGVVFDYFLNTHNRLSIDGNGSTVISVIHVADNGQPMDNAYWNGAMMAYGDGKNSFKPLAGGIDVAAHEMSHGVIQETVGLEYKFQAGALNESFADIFGVMVDREDWLLGEDIVLPQSYPSGAMRDMANPNNGGVTLSDQGWQPASMNEYVELNIDQDNGGVHINSGIPNRACYLIAQAVGREKTETIYYRVLEARYLNTQSTFVDMRLAAIRAAKELYGENSTEVAHVANAFDTVGILDGTGTPPPPDTPAVQGEQYVLAIASDPNDQSLYIALPVIEMDEDIQQLTSTKLYSNTNNSITVSENGLIILFIDSDNNLRQYTDEGDVIIEDSGIWKSIDISPDGTLLAATSLNEDKTIYVFDLVSGGSARQYTLLRPTTQEGIYEDIVVFADALDWDLTGKYLLYDALNRFSLASGETIEQWDMNILDVENDVIQPIFAPQSKEINIGNPTFAQTNDAVFVFDYMDTESQQAAVYALNIFSGELSAQPIVVNSAANGFNPARPRFSTNDDLIVYQNVEAGYALINKQAITQDRLHPQGNPESYLSGGTNPYWFAVGSRPQTAVQNKTSAPQEFGLLQNYPNPFNPSTTIQFQLTTDSDVQLFIYNSLGQKIRTLIDNLRVAGEHSVSWNGQDDAGNPVSSGIYFYTLIAGDKQETQKMMLLQ